jgi:hypothetical protein
MYSRTQHLKLYNVQFPSHRKIKTQNRTKVYHLPLHNLNTCRLSKHAWQDSLHIHVHNTGNLQIKSLSHNEETITVHLYNTCSKAQETVTYFIAEVMNFSLYLTSTGVQCLPSGLSTHASLFPVLPTLSHTPGKASYKAVTWMV